MSTLLTKKEEQMITRIKKNKTLQEAISKEIGKTVVTIYQMALYRPQRLLRAEAVRRLASAFTEPTPLTK
jgi:hypothetical protein